VQLPEIFQLADDPSHAVLDLFQGAGQVGKRIWRDVNELRRDLHTVVPIASAKV
jgi:hypothetical protein